MDPQRRCWSHHGRNVSMSWAATSAFIRRICPSGWTHSAAHESLRNNPPTGISFRTGPTGTTVPEDFPTNPCHRSNELTAMPWLLANSSALRPDRFHLSTQSRRCSEFVRIRLLNPFRFIPKSSPTAASPGRCGWPDAYVILTFLSGNVCLLSSFGPYSTPFRWPSSVRACGDGSEPT